VFKTSYVFIFLILASLFGCTCVKVDLTEQQKESLLNPPSNVVDFVQRHLDSSLTFFENWGEAVSQENIKHLSDCMKDKASLLGVQSPETVEVVVTQDLPVPEKENELYEVYLKVVGDPKDAGAITYGHRIYVKPLFSNSYSIILHELVHVMQYQKYGKKYFLRQYMIASQLVQYHKIPFEAEAFIKALSFSQAVPDKCENLYM